MIEYMNIHQEIAAYKMEINGKGQTDNNLSKSISYLNELMLKGKELLSSDRRALSILNYLINKDIKHIFLVNQIFAFYTPPIIPKPERNIFGIKKIETFDGGDGLFILQYIRNKVEKIIKQNDMSDDPRKSPIKIFESCLEFNKYLKRARIVI